MNDIFKHVMEYDNITTKLGHKKINKAKNNIKNEKEKKHILFQSLILKFFLCVIEQLIQNGADITTKQKIF